MANVDTSFYSRPDGAQANPFAFIEHYGQVGNLLTGLAGNQQALAARQAIGPLLSMITRPDGTLDESRLQAALARYPQAGYQMPDILRTIRETGLALANTSLAKQHTKQSEMETLLKGAEIPKTIADTKRIYSEIPKNQAETGLALQNTVKSAAETGLTNANMQDRQHALAAQVAGAIVAGDMDHDGAVQLISQMHQQFPQLLPFDKAVQLGMALPTDKAGLKAAAKSLYQSNFTTPELQKAMFGDGAQVLDFGGQKGAYTLPQDPAYGGLKPRGAPLPNTLTPESKLHVIEGTDPATGAPTKKLVGSVTDPQGNLLPVPPQAGRATPVATQPEPTYGGVPFSIPQIVPQAAPDTVATGVNPAIGPMMESGGKAYQTALEQSKAYAPTMQALDTARKLLAKMPDNATGKGATWLHENRQALVSAGLLDATESGKDFEILAKNLNRVISNLPGSERSDMAQAMAVASNASVANMTPALKVLVSKGTALARQQQAAFSAFAAPAGGTDDPKTSLAAKAPWTWPQFASKWATEVDPVAYSWDMMGSEEQKKVLGGKSTEQKLKLLRQVRDAHKLGFLDTPDAPTAAATPAAAPATAALPAPSPPVPVVAAPPPIAASAPSPASVAAPPPPVPNQLNPYMD